MRSIRSYMPSNEIKQKIIFARVQPEFLSQIKSIAKKNDWKVADMIRSSLHKFIDDELNKSEPVRLKQLNLL